MTVKEIELGDSFNDSEDERCATKRMEIDTHTIIASPLAQRKSIVENRITQIHTQCTMLFVRALTLVTQMMIKILT